MDEVKKSKKSIAFLWNWAFKVMGEDELNSWRYINRVNSKRFVYSVGDIDFYNLAEVDASLLMENYLNSVWINTMTAWQKRMQVTWVLVAGACLMVLLLLWHSYGAINDLKNEIIQGVKVEWIGESNKDKKNILKIEEQKDQSEILQDALNNKRKKNVK